MGKAMQNQNNKSLEALYSVLGGRARIDALNSRAWELRAENSAYAMSIAEYAIGLSRKGSRPYLAGEAHGHNTLALCHWIRDEFPAALPLAMHAQGIFKKINDPKGIGGAATVLGLIHWKMANPEGAWEAWQEAYDRFMQIKYLSGVGNSLMNLALLLRSEGQLEVARSYYLSALEIMSSEGNRMGVGNIQNNLGFIELELGNYVAAAKWSRKAFFVQRDLKNYRSVANAGCNLALALLRQGQCQWARGVLLLSQRYFGYGSYPTPSPSNELAWVEYHLQPNCPDRDLAGAHGRIQRLLAGDLDEDTRFKIFNLLPRLYEQLGKPAEANAALWQLVRLNESRFVRHSSFRLRRQAALATPSPVPPIANASVIHPINPASLLTGRQLQIFDAIGRGLLNKEIASELGLSLHTVQAHRRQIAERLAISGSQLSHLAVASKRT